jgi:hypothetical protein
MPKEGTKISTSVHLDKHNWSQRQVDETLAHHGFSEDPGLVLEHFHAAGHTEPEGGVEVLEVDHTAGTVRYTKNGEANDYSLDEWNEVNQNG